MSAGSMGKRWPGAIQDDEHVQAVLRTLAQFVERDTVYYKHEEAMLRQLRNAHRLRGKYTDETKQQLHATLMKVGERTIQEQIGVERKTHGRKTPGSTQRVYWGALSSGPLDPRAAPITRSARALTTLDQCSLGDLIHSGA
jgi:hypothetical protein